MTTGADPGSSRGPPLLSLSGRTALVTGGSRGIGAATAVLLAEAGARVAITYRSRKAEAERVVKACASTGAFAVRADFADPETAERAVTAAHERLGGLDVFVANAGIWVADDVPVIEMAAEQWRRTMAINLDAVFHGCRAALRVMAEAPRENGSGGGRIVVVSSTAAQRGEAFHADYAASKGAITALVKSLCLEAAPRGTTVNAVAPGWVDTEMVRERFERRGGGGKREIVDEIPLRRVAAPEDVAGPIAFLCSDLARHVTGEVLNVNGGAARVG